MGIKSIDIETFIQLSKKHIVLDVRSPKEYLHAHFPDAFSFPIFSDEERKEIGTAYKQISRKEAVKIGLRYFSSKMLEMVESVEQLTSNRNDKTVLVHCWRGGMRSGAVAWLLDLYGFNVYQLQGGYKAFRNWVLRQFEIPYNLCILSGSTGSGKTEILHEFQRFGEAVVDLEGLALHRGSTFGGIGLPKQPSNEYFENKLALTLFHLTEENSKRMIWVESESSRIGNDVVNFKFHEQMKNAQRIHIEIPQQERLKYIVEEYGGLDKQELEDAVARLKKRLGGLQTQNAIQYLEEGKIREAFQILIQYYDKAYNSSSLFQPAFLTISLVSTDAKTNAQIIRKKLNEIYV